MRNLPYIFFDTISHPVYRKLTPIVSLHLSPIFNSYLKLPDSLNIHQVSLSTGWKSQSLVAVKLLKTFQRSECRAGLHFYTCCYCKNKNLNKCENIHHPWGMDIFFMMKLFNLKQRSLLALVFYDYKSFPPNTKSIQLTVETHNSALSVSPIFLP